MCYDCFSQGLSEFLEDSFIPFTTTTTMLPNNKFPSDQPLGIEQLKTVWSSVSGDLKATLGKTSFELWFGQSRLLKVDENHAVISSPGSMYAIWIEENFRDILKVHLDKYLMDLKGFSLDYSQSDESRTRQ